MSTKKVFSVGEVVRFYGKPFYIAWIDGEKIGLTSMCERKYYMTTTCGALGRIRDNNSFENKKPSVKPSLSQPKPKPKPRPEPTMREVMMSWTVKDWAGGKQ